MSSLAEKSPRPGSLRRDDPNTDQHETVTPLHTSRPAAKKVRDSSWPGDGDLLWLVESGDAEAFAALYDRHGRAAYSLAYRMMGNRQAAEDLVQEGFIKIWRSATSYRAERGSVRTWVLSIVHNRGIDHLRSSASRRRTQEKVELTAQTSQPSEAFAETWRNTQRGQIQAALKTLPPEQLKILEMTYYSGYTHTEVAEMLELPLGTVKGRMRLGMKKIRDYLEALEAA